MAGARMTKASRLAIETASKIYVYIDADGTASLEAVRADGWRAWIQGADGVMGYPSRWHARAAIKKIRRDIEPEEPHIRRG